MKKKLLIALSAWFACVPAGYILAQQSVMPAVPIAVEVRVRDPDRAPVEGATVLLALPRAEGRLDQASSATTSRDGIARVSGVAEQAYRVRVEKVGFYPTRGPLHDADAAAGIHKMEFELRPVRNPVQRPISRRILQLPLPATQEALGFDLELGDWIAPHGRGKTADFIFTVDGYFRSLRNFDESLTLSFSRPCDGIQPRRFPPFTGSAFKFPYEAPESGYDTRRTWRRTFDGTKRSTDFDRTDEMNYIFRVRTELDENGRVKRALYGVFFGEIELVGNPELGRNLKFTYALNPDWTPNIEFDPATVPAPFH